MKIKFFAMIAAAVLMLGMAACTSVDNPSSTDPEIQEQDLVGLWLDVFEYEDVTEAGVPFSKVMLAVDVKADHTGCLYLGVFDEAEDELWAVYGGPEDAGFTWKLLPDGSVELTDLTTGESAALTRGDNDKSYGDKMTDVASTSVSVSGGGMKVTNGDFSGTLVKADADKAAEIQKELSSLSPDRQNFEAQMSQMMANGQQYVKIDPTMKGVKLLTEFINQLKIDALGPQVANIIIGVLGKKAFVVNPSLNTPEAEEAKWALANSNFPNDKATSYLLLNAATALNNTALEFTTGKETAEYVSTEDGAFTISCKNATSGAVTKVKLKFSGADDGVAIFLANMSGTPLAVQFPHKIDIELLRSESGSGMDAETVMTGQIALESTDGSKYISLKRSEWRATLTTEAKKADRYEIPALELIHHADHTIEVSASMGINDATVLKVKANNDPNPYSDEEIEQLSELRDIAPMGKGLYTLLKAFNSRTATAQITVLDELLFDISVHDVGQCIKAAGYALKYRKQDVPKETIDPWTDLLNKSLTYSVTQKKTGVTAEGKFVTSLFAGHNLPTFALRFQGESDYQVVHERMNATDRQNFEALMKSFDEPLVAVNALLKAIQDKGVELKQFNPFK